VVRQTTRLWRKHHLDYDQTKYVIEQVRRRLGLAAPATRPRTVERLDRAEVERLIASAYRDGSQRGLMIKTLFLTGARVSEFVHIRVEDLHLDDDPPDPPKRQGPGQSLCADPAGPGAGAAHPLQGRRQGYLFESNRLPGRILSEAAVDLATVESIQREPLAQGPEGLQVVLHGVGIACVQALGDLLQALAGSPRDRVAAFQERPRASAVFRRRRVPPSDTDRVGLPRLRAETAFDPNLVLPRVAEVVLVEKPLIVAELEVVELDLACILSSSKIGSAFRSLTERGARLLR
jgi:hypothetical protein